MRTPACKSRQKAAPISAPISAPIRSRSVDAPVGSPTASPDDSKSSDQASDGGSCQAASVPEQAPDGPTGARRDGAALAGAEPVGTEPVQLSSQRPHGPSRAKGERRTSAWGLEADGVKHAGWGLEADGAGTRTAGGDRAVAAREDSAERRHERGAAEEGATPGQEQRQQGTRHGNEQCPLVPRPPPGVRPSSPRATKQRDVSGASPPLAAPEAGATEAEAAMAPSISSAERCSPPSPSPSPYRSAGRPSGEGSSGEGLAGQRTLPAAAAAPDLIDRYLEAKRQSPSRPGTANVAPGHDQGASGKAVGAEREREREPSVDVSRAMPPCPRGLVMPAAPSHAPRRWPR